MSRTSDLIRTGDIDLTSELQRVTDDVNCPASQVYCTFDVPLVNDQVGAFTILE